MFKIVKTLILFSLLSPSIYALDLNSTNEILEQATQATKDITAELEPIVNKEILEIIEEENPTIETTTIEMEQIPYVAEVIESTKNILPVVEQTPTTEVVVTQEKKIETTDTKSNSNHKDVIEKEMAEKGDPRKGKNIFKYVLKEDCKMTAYKFAEKHTQEEWLEILEENRVKETIIKSCPDVEKYYQDKWTDDLYQFFYEASNEDEIPEC